MLGTAAHRRFRHIPERGGGIRWRPQHLRVVAQVRELLAQYPPGAALERLHHRCWRIGRADPHEQMHMLGHHFASHDPPALPGSDLPQQLVEATGDSPTHNLAPRSRPPHQMQTQRAHACRRVAKPALPHTTNATRRHRQNSPTHTVHQPPRFPRRLKPPAPRGSSVVHALATCRRVMTNSPLVLRRPTGRR